LVDPKILVLVKACCHLDGRVNGFATLGLSVQPHIVVNTQEPDGGFPVDRFEYFALIPNAMGYPGLKTLGAMNFRIGLEVMGTAVSAACLAPPEQPPIGEIITGRNYVFVIRVNIISRVARQILEVLCFLQECLGSVLR